ncbi:hypothetical protein [Bacillus toyonensis]|uniref:hypothetical protein n=1 Tax=Bacillus toyonensis TaxID=155322 RepID=UPI0014440E38|nr:hypothetical protein [Bacillus toyonensis]NKW96676.1 hypothetical protein [Bacillus toyonensis]HDR7848900.1 hypothetical protein [Bacillus toyonensis]
MFELTSNTYVKKDKSGRTRHIEHIQKPFLSTAPEALEAESPESLADQYLSEVTSIYQFEDGLLNDISGDLARLSSPQGARLHRSKKVKDIAGSKVVNYTQSFDGFPIWRAGFSVHIATNPMRVTSSTSTLQEAITLSNDSEKAVEEYQKLMDPENLSKLLGVQRDNGVSKINGTRLVIYQYNPHKRVDEEEKNQEGANIAFEEGIPKLSLPAIPDTIKANNYYVTAEVLFDLDIPDWKGLHWIALIEPISGAVLYLRALTACATGKVFRMDPISLSGDPSLTPAASETSLNSWRENVVLTDLNVTNPQNLKGKYVDLKEIESPVEAGPTTTTPFAFDYNVKTTNFSAVSAYYHVNWFFNLMIGMGFNLEDYFDGTDFPVPVDHWALGGATNVNAHAQGNAMGNGIGHFCFASAQAGQKVSIADDIRVVIHEFGHALLWDHVNSPNFGFAHSPGDSLAAILMDPISKAPDRFLTFPWPQTTAGPLDRRHDRSVADGWGWFGNKYNTQYNGEQMLSTTLFRLYRSVGGDSPHLGDRLWASRYVSYLIIKAVGTLTNTTDDPEVFVTALMNADLTTDNFEGHPGGALHKVIRWAFEKQGLYQSNAVPDAPAPVTKEGNPPDVDVFIDDGRNGEYQYLYAFWESQDMWVRHSPDGGKTHQDPIVGRPNYMYVRVKNRGKMAANNVIVKAYSSNPSSGLLWPDHWSPMDTPQLTSSESIPSGSNSIIGPFTWTPEVSGQESLLAIVSAAGDPGNDSTVFSPIPHSRFVPFDNNISQRNVHSVLVNDWNNITKSVNKISFEIVNPFKKTLKVELLPVLPKLLLDQNYWIMFSNPGGNKFELRPSENKKVVLSLVNQSRIPSRRPWNPLPVKSKPGILQPEEILERTEISVNEEFYKADKPMKFHIITLMDDQNMGGTTYILQNEKENPSGLLEEPKVCLENSEISNILDTLNQHSGIKSIKIKKVRLDIEFKE